MAIDHLYRRRNSARQPLDVLMMTMPPQIFQCIVLPASPCTGEHILAFILITYDADDGTMMNTSTE